MLKYMNEFQMFASVPASHPKPPASSPNQGAAVWIPVACFPLQFHLGHLAAA